MMWCDNIKFSMNLCRLCANYSEVAVPIFGKGAEKDRIDLKIKRCCLPIVVREEDYKPKQICFTCASKLEVCIELMELALVSDSKFESLIQERQANQKCIDPIVSEVNQDEESVEKNSRSLVTILDSQQQRSSQLWADDGSKHGNTLTVQQDGSVIVVSKMDSEAQREPCQDILLMVELKYKDGPENDQSVRTHTVAYNAQYTVDTNKSSTLPCSEELPAEKGVRPVAYTVDTQQMTDTKTYTLSYSADGHPIALSKTHAFTYSDENGQNSLTKTHMLTYSGASDLANKPATIVYETQPLPLTKTQVLEYSNGSQPETLVKSTDLQFSNEEHSSHKIPEQIAFSPNIITAVSKQDLVINSSKTFTEDSDHTPINHAATGSSEKCVNGNEESAVKQSNKPFSCSICGKSFMRRTNLNVHMAVHTEERPYECDQCDKKFVLRWDLTLHKRIHDGLFSCEFCNKAFTVKGKLERHRRTHTGERPFVCPTCGKAFGDKRNLESHTTTHSDERPFSCATCGRKFRVRSHLTDHYRVHSQDTPYTCDTCGKSFKWKTNLNIHLKVHTGERFPCEECGREFGRQADLTKHQRSHTGERPHICGICRKSYGDRATLQKHVKSHSDYKPYICEVCGKGFHFHWYLNTHKKIHLEKNYSCDSRGKIFNKKNISCHTKPHTVDQQI